MITEKQELINKHIAKFGEVVEGTEFYWVSSVSVNECIKYMRKIKDGNILFLQMKLPNGMFMHVNGAASRWKYFIKYEPEAPVWHELEIRHAVGSNTSLADMIIHNLKRGPVPEPKMVERNYSQKLKWLSEQPNSEKFEFGVLINGNMSRYYALVQTATHYRERYPLSWKEIPKIESEN